ncbi:sigma-54-dependent transcriptional regulator [Oleidesulfovibrio sp.]|uniref:sigma-54-dependent transcriptional regulator n=1 Tax=Oleidesulfovibrio sp. TaxID=2909707 RepID=UPI003A8C0FBF
MGENLKRKERIVIVDDSKENVHLLSELLTQEGYVISPFTHPDRALSGIEQHGADLILLDVDMPSMSGFDMISVIRNDLNCHDIPIIFISALADIETRIKAFKSGARDYISRPFYREEVLARVTTQLTLSRQHKALQQEIVLRKSAEERLVNINQELEIRIDERTRELREAYETIKELKAEVDNDNSYLREEIFQKHNFGHIVGQSTPLKGLLTLIKQVAKTDSTALLLGETGTGKELIARAIHSSSGRNSRPLIKVDCASLPPTLIESELFGHERGAFSGADRARTGRFELANNGTLFLDEIGELPLALQSKLLRVLQDGEFERVGGNKTLKTNIRFIAATHRDLQAFVRDGKFREDLWFRLNVFPIRVPPLRSRVEDIPLLVKHLVEKHSSRIGKRISKVPGSVIRKLIQYSWPENVRELENIIERLIILSPGDELDSSALQLPSDLIVPEKKLKLKEVAPEHKANESLAEVEKNHIERVLEAAEWKIDGPGGGAEILGLNPSTLRFRMKKHKIKRPI